MSNSPIATPQKTISGADLPVVAVRQARLLTVNLNDIPILNDALAEGVGVQVLRADIEMGEWVLLATFKPGAQVPMHYHTGCVDGYTMSGSWYYLEYPDDVQVAGSYLFEPGGSIHTLHVPDSNTEDTVVYFRIHGANVNFNDDGSFNSVLDASSVQVLTAQLAAEQNKSFRYLGGGTVGLVDQTGHRPE